MLQIRTSLLEDNHYDLQISEITKSDSHMSYRSDKQIGKSIGDGNLIFVFKENELAGFVEIVNIWQDWNAIFSFYIMPKYRQQGIAKQLVDKIISLYRNEYLYAATSNKIMLQILTTVNFKLSKLANLPILFLFNYVLKRFINRQLLYNLKNIKQNWNYLVMAPTGISK